MYILFIQYFIAYKGKDRGKNTKTLLITVNIFHHFINLEIFEVKFPVRIGSWREAGMGTALVIHILDQGYFKCFDVTSGVPRSIYCTIPVCKLLYRSRTCRLITVINKH